MERLVRILNYSRTAVLVGILLLRCVAWIASRRSTVDDDLPVGLPRISGFQDARDGFAVYSGVSIFGFTVLGALSVAIFFGPSRHLGFPQPLMVAGFGVVLSLVLAYIGTRIESKVQARRGFGVDIFAEPFLYISASACGALLGFLVAVLVSVALPPWRDILG